MYKELLIELQIFYQGSSYEIWKQLQSKKNQQKALMSSQNSREENDAILQKLHAIQEAEAYYEKTYYNYIKAAEHDDTDALEKLGLYLKNGRLLISDFAKHDKWMERCRM